MEVKSDEEDHTLINDLPKEQLQPRRRMTEVEIRQELGTVTPRVTKLPTGLRPGLKMKANLTLKNTGSGIKLSRKRFQEDKATSKFTSTIDKVAPETALSTQIVLISSTSLVKSRPCQLMLIQPLQLRSNNLTTRTRVISSKIRTCLAMKSHRANNLATSRRSASPSRAT